jgi:hypothetical protein
LVLPVDKDQFLVVRKSLLDGGEAVAEAGTGLSSTFRRSSALDVLGYLIGAREDLDVVESFLEPEVAVCALTLCNSSLILSVRAARFWTYEIQAIPREGINVASKARPTIRLLILSSRNTLGTYSTTVLVRCVVRSGIPKRYVWSRRPARENHPTTIASP